MPDDIKFLKRSDGSVSKVIMQPQVMEDYGDESAIDLEISGIKAAISDIENFKQRRLDTLNQRLDELAQVKTVIKGEIINEPQDSVK